MKVAKIIFYSVLYVIVISILLLVGYVFVNKVFLKEQLPMIFGVGAAVVVSGSMSPTINVNDMIIIQKQNEYVVGDIVTFKNKDNIVVTHRIVRVENGDFVTKGDYFENDEDTDLLKFEQIYGKVISVWAGVGGILAFLQSPVGLLLIVLVIVLIYLFVRMFKSKKSKKIN